MNEFVDMFKAAVLLVFAISVIVASFYMMTIIIPIIIVMGLIYFIAILIGEAREE